ncbi:cytochrome d ubiquinol oxidase subunit II [Candidatus Similichlamydia laticola]|uniref:Cytochrome d ubiquinol oxidase subunit II n=1 Tax=Candidatus Similichlamydia laticola TaxID=2170265 RepID=A0A369KAJ2_9BACT|nr:cytochrome d ubiquinol oxidase subunit II [Candidatus Similichlamydia laticola]RDB31621.1 Cytochrome d ubiquinol oxidase subunit II [Candidatus Similichlamydia laticola]
MSGIQQLSLVLYTFLIAGYVILDGYDLGVGILHVFRTREADKKKSLRVVGAKWDWNEIWLVSGGGVLFAGVPKVSATLFQSFRFIWVALVAGLVLKPLFVFYRKKVESACLQKILDIGISLSCSLVAFSGGFLSGQLVIGLPVAPSGALVKNAIVLFSPYAIVMGLTAVCLFAVHGSFYLLHAAPDKKQERLDRLVVAFSILSVLACLVCLILLRTQHQEVFERLLMSPLAIFMMSLGLIASTSALLLQARGSSAQAFGLSYVAILAPLFSVSLIGLFPVYVSLHPREKSFAKPLKKMESSLDALVSLHNSLED